MKKLYVSLLLSSLCVFCLFGQSHIITTKSPNSYGRWTYCECRIPRGTATSCRTPGAVPIVGDAVVWSTTTDPLSGFHNHTAYLRPNILLVPDPGGLPELVTDFQGCAYAWAFLPGYAGHYNINVSGAIGLGADASIDARTFGFIPNVPALNMTLDPDPLHSNAHNFSQPGVAVLWSTITTSYGQFTGARDLEFIRMSLAQGGVSDNDPGAPIPGLWDVSVETGEEHNNGSEADVRNPSIQAMEAAPFPRFQALTAAVFNSVVCQFGPLSPGEPNRGAGGSPVGPGYWLSHPFIHLSCTSSPIPKHKKN